MSKPVAHQGTVPDDSAGFQVSLNGRIGHQGLFQPFSTYLYEPLQNSPTLIYDFLTKKKFTVHSSDRAIMDTHIMLRSSASLGRGVQRCVPNAPCMFKR